MRYIVLADRQDITRAGLMYICQAVEDVPVKSAEDKVELIERLRQEPDSVVLLDYTLFDINDADELLILGQRFQQAHWILFSEDLSQDFVRRLIASSPAFSVVLKESPLHEIRDAIGYALRGHR